MPYTFKEDHDLIMQCKTAITPLIRAIPKLTEACEALEADGAAALWRLQAEQELLRSGQVGTVQQLLSEREAAYTALRTELVEVEEGHDFSVRALLSRLAKEQEAHRATEERRAELDEERQDLSAQLDALKKDMAILKVDHQVALEEERRRHHQVALEEERRRHARTRAELCAEVGILKGELVLLERSSEQTAEELTGRLGALAIAKEQSESSLRDEAHAKEEAGKRLASRLTEALEGLKHAKADSERDLEGQLTQRAGEQAELLRKIGVMEKLQEKALGVGQPGGGRSGAGAAAGVNAGPPPPAGPDTRNPMANDPHRSRTRATLYAMSVERGVAAGKVQAPRP